MGGLRYEMRAAIFFTTPPLIHPLSDLRGGGVKCLLLPPLPTAMNTRVKIPEVGGGKRGNYWQMCTPPFAERGVILNILIS